jgi:hypothetical protein
MSESKLAIFDLIIIIIKSKINSQFLEIFINLYNFLITFYSYHHYAIKKDLFLFSLSIEFNLIFLNFYAHHSTLFEKFSNQDFC